MMYESFKISCQYIILFYVTVFRLQIFNLAKRMKRFTTINRNNLKFTQRNNIVLRAMQLNLKFDYRKLFSSICKWKLNGRLQYHQIVSMHVQVICRTR